MEVMEPLFDKDNGRYVPIKSVGSGAYGTVWSCIDRETNKKVAVKKIANVFENSLTAMRILREMKLLRHIKHENVISLTDVIIPTRKRTFKDVYLVYELMDTDLHHIIGKSSLSLSNEHCQWFLFQLLQGLKCLHDANVLHRDLKPDNLFVNANCDLKIGDFGLARTAVNGLDCEFMTEYVVTRYYRAPELLLCLDKYGSYGTSIDVWSVGCIFAELLGREPFFTGIDSLNQIKLILCILGSPDDSDLEFIDNPRVRAFVKSRPYSRGEPFSELFPNADPLAIDLLQKLLTFDPTKRITVSEALNHPYFADIYDPMCEPTAIKIDIVESESVETIREMMWNEMLHYHPPVDV